MSNLDGIVVPQDYLQVLGPAVGYPGTGVASGVASGPIFHTEADPNGKQTNTPGAKLDAGKAPVMRGAVRYFPRALRVIAQISDKGARKYSWKGWESVPNGEDRYADARGRHELKIGEGEIWDDGPGGTGELHLGQVAWNALAELELFLRRTENEKK